MRYQEGPGTIRAQDGSGETRPDGLHRRDQEYTKLKKRENTNN